MTSPATAWQRHTAEAELSFAGILSCGSLARIVVFQEVRNVLVPLKRRDAERS